MKMLEKINVKPHPAFLKDYTTFQIGGFCPTFYEPQSLEELLPLWKLIQQEKVPYFILGAGSNILASDNEIQKVIICLSKWQTASVEDNLIHCQAGVKTNQLCEIALKNSLSGFEFMYGLPASVGGALFMNARCFGGEISDNLLSVELLNAQGKIETYKTNLADFTYKVSPFQKEECILLSAKFILTKNNPLTIETLMRKNWQNRHDKGHFKAPSGGSFFKNDYELGIPSGLLIEEAGMKGYRVGGAQIAPWHANFLINAQGASAQDVLKLAEEVKKKVKQETGVELEEEVLFLQ